MKLSKREAQLLIAEAATSDPLPDALDRVLNHDWTFDPRGQQISLALRRYHEQDQVLYGTWSRFRKELVSPYAGTTCLLRCDLCASAIPSAPFFTAENHTAVRYEFCCACVSAMGVRVSASSRVVRVLPSVDRSRVSVPRAFAALRKTLRRLFG